MRYLSSISLALIALMALACAATPATPVPTATPTVCDSLSENLAAAQTETAARVLTNAWMENGCHDATGRGVRRTPTKIPTATPDIWANARLYYTWKDILTSYKFTSEGQRHADCLRQINVNSNTSTITARYDQGFLGIAGDYWIIEVTGNACRAIETWHIDDNTGKVTYWGSSLDK